MHGHRLTRHQRLLATVTFFSMFFGAGNLIFPPFLGVQAGSATVPAAAGFIVSAVGLPILGVLAVSAAGGFEQLANRVSPKFSLVLGVAIILTIGPCFAIPRTATTSFEMAVVPFTADAPRWLTQLVYSLVFFALSFVMAQHPERLSKTLGRFMGPLLLVLIAVLFAACLVIGHGAFTAPYGNYASGQLARGFLDGYQTMDLLAALYFGIVISANVREMGVTDESANRRETGLAGVGTGVMLIAVYGALSYVGMVSGAFATIDPAKDNGATVLTNLTASAFGPWGTAFVGLVFAHLHLRHVFPEPLPARGWPARLLPRVERHIRRVQLHRLERRPERDRHRVGAGAGCPVPDRDRAGRAGLGPSPVLGPLPAHVFLDRAAGWHRQRRRLPRPADHRVHRTDGGPAACGHAVAAVFGAARMAAAGRHRTGDRRRRLAGQGDDRGGALIRIQTKTSWTSTM